MHFSEFKFYCPGQIYLFSEFFSLIFPFIVIEKYDIYKLKIELKKDKQKSELIDLIFSLRLLTSTSAFNLSWKMNTFLSRLNTIFAFTLSVMAALTFCCFLTTAFNSHKASVYLGTGKAIV